MYYKFDSTDTYRIIMHDKILKVAPLTAISAALTFTIARLFGWFESVDLISLICFDVVCFSYCIPAFIFIKLGVIKDDKLSSSSMKRTNIVLVSLVVLQWNLISYIFPTESFWGFAPMFALLTAFMFNFKAVLACVASLSVSIAISWLINGEHLLPPAGHQYEENLILRIVALIVSFSVVLILTYLAEKFTKIVKDNYKDLQMKNAELENTGRDVLDFTADIIEERDSVSGSHVKRIRDYTKVLAKQVSISYPEYNLSEEKIEQISLACVLHDIGKIAIPDSILSKPGRLDAAEFETIKTHTSIGAKIIDKMPESISNEYKSLCKEICLFHHERYDGKGYPTGIKGDDIPISAQIVAVVDCFDALSNDRPYKKALPKEVSINMILNGECGVFSEKIKNCIIQCKDTLLSM